MMMQHATTLKVVTPALATLDTLVMDLFAHVSLFMFPSDQLQLAALCSLCTLALYPGRS